MDKTKIDISGMNKAAVLAALYNAARPQGMGHLHYKPGAMTVERADALLKETTYFDYVGGRVMKVDLEGDVLSTRLYDRDNGENAAWRALEAGGLVPQAAAVR